jgi:succinate dehydrogenase / fumarate reductase flavoprotein subunit
MRIYPAIHYTMGGLWVDYNLMTTVPGLYALGEANFSDHGANRLGASALMQGLADGYFVLPYTIGDYLAPKLGEAPLSTDDPAFTRRSGGRRPHPPWTSKKGGTHGVEYYHRELGKIVWEYCGMARNETGLEKALSEIPALREEFRKNVKVLGSPDGINTMLEKVNRVDDFMEFAELKARDALHRAESCGGHFREESQTEEGEALRDDENFAYVGAWEWNGDDQAQTLHKEALNFENVALTQRSYK